MRSPLPDDGLVAREDLMHELTAQRHRRRRIALPRKRVDSRVLARVRHQLALQHLPRVAPLRRCRARDLHQIAESVSQLVVRKSARVGASYEVCTVALIAAVGAPRTRGSTTLRMLHLLELNDVCGAIGVEPAQVIAKAVVWLA